MMRVVKTLGLCLLLTHSPSYALSIGDIRVKSSLNDHFSAEITLALNAGDNPDAIHVQLAPFDKFSERGIPWDRSLLKLKFEPILRTNQSVVIRVRSTGVITEPVLVFLLQVSSPKGTVYKQFTILLDPPPVHYEPVRVKRLSVPQVTMAKQYDVEVTGNQRMSFDRPKARLSKPNTPSGEIKKKTDWLSVRKNDGLLKIAMRASVGRQVSPEQMAIALFNNNPKAFYSSNINALKAGLSLKIPDRKSIIKLSAAEAKSEFFRQNKAWKDRLLPPVVPPVANQKKLTLSAPTEAVVEQNAVLTDVTNKTIVKPTNNVEINYKINELQERLVKMEQQLSAMQKSLLVKDQQLALLQSGPLHEAKPNSFSAWFNAFFHKQIQFFKTEGRSVLYIAAGLLELMVLGFLGYYGNKKIITKVIKKTKENRY